MSNDGGNGGAIWAGEPHIGEGRDCFVIMPISDPDGYAKGHFRRVFDDIFSPAITAAGFRPVRGDQVRQTNLIHPDVLQKLIDSPMALCDLSSRNPNVLFELGLRQAFDKPVVLVREVGTPDVFDIAPLRYCEYRKDRIYHEVLEDQRSIAEAVRATESAFKKGDGVNSIVRLLSLTRPAALAEVREADNDPLLQIVRAEISQLRSEIRSAVRSGAAGATPGLGARGTEEAAEPILRAADATLLGVGRVHGSRGKEAHVLSDEDEQDIVLALRSARGQLRLLDDYDLNIEQNRRHQYLLRRLRHLESEFDPIPSGASTGGGPRCRGERWRSPGGVLTPALRRDGHG